MTNQLAPQGIQALDGGCLDVLIADHDDTTREQMAKVARRAHRVETVTDQAGAIAAIRERCFDVVLLDAETVFVDGFAAIPYLRQIAPGIHIVLTSATGSISEAIAATRAKADYVTKPVSAAALFAALDPIAARRVARRSSDDAGKCPLVGRSPAIMRLRHEIEVVAQSDGAVIVYGESGTGKELVARMIHAASPRRDHPLVAVNCAAFPDGLLEAELFGHERGAFTGAVARREGRFEAAHNGTLFLDEVGEMPLVAQAKLLRVLEQGTFQRLGSNLNIRVDVRIVSATHRDLEQLVASGRFREDLYYRIKLFRLAIPPLRARRVDLPALIDHLIESYAQEGEPRPSLSAAAWALLCLYGFPGNVRELQHAIRHALTFSGGEEIRVEHLPPEVTGERMYAARAGGEQAAEDGTLVPLTSALIEFEHKYLLDAIERTEGNRSRAATALGITRKSLWAKLKRYRGQQMFGCAMQGNKGMQ
jgi:DNA-binding NtrC family response regulator